MAKKCRSVTIPNMIVVHRRVYVSFMLIYQSRSCRFRVIQVNIYHVVIYSSGYVPHYPTFYDQHALRACLYGLGYPRQPSPRDNFTKRLYENCVTERQLTLLNYGDILRRNKHHHLPLFLCSSSFIKYSCVLKFIKWTNTS